MFFGEVEMAESKEEEKAARGEEEKRQGLCEGETEVDNLMKQLQQIRNEGNEFFRNSDFPKASQSYSNALSLISSASFSSSSLQEEEVTLLCNRATSYLKEKKYSLSLADSQRALSLAPSHPKALYRQAVAFSYLGSSSFPDSLPPSLPLYLS